MQITYQCESAADILDQVDALLAYQLELLETYRNEGARLDGQEVYGAAVFNQVLRAMLKAAKERGREEDALARSPVLNAA